MNFVSFDHSNLEEVVAVLEFYLVFVFLVNGFKILDLF